MMNKRLIFAIITAASLLLISGCSSSTEPQTSGGSSKTFNGGTDGILVEFMDNAPPSEVFDSPESLFDISLRIQNAGEDDVQAGEAFVQISGIDPADFGNAQMKKTVDFDLIGTKLDPQGRVIPGTIANVDFNNFYFSRKLAGNVLFNVRADVCYKYTGKAIAKLCFRENLLSPPKDSDVCDATRSVNPENAGSPVHIQDFAQQAIGKSKISFSFKVKHVGTGKIFSPELSGDQMCDDSTIANEDKVRVDRKSVV